LFYALKTKLTGVDVAAFHPFDAGLATTTTHVVSEEAVRKYPVFE
jgi:hypothetical protein